MLATQAHESVLHVGLISQEEEKVVVLTYA